ncbi:unnamed protein product [Anisakis simplex]|uniref:Sodium/hydrogen exchanger 8 n=1 Tax=Anisakis simplex TaxID=6269 RepID=A0A3P6QKF4_ANISI|nr:unnamed protein product [Anisakis simplex]
MAIFFILMVIVLATLLVHLLIVSKFHYIPESLAIVMLGAFIGFVLSYSERDWREVESFSPNFFFLVLLPPIIFESGYNLHKGDFFANIFPILTFAIIGTAVSAFVIGSSLYILGQADLIYRLSAMESFAFGSMISAVDPVATLAIFQALNVEPILYMLVFGESMLNDAVAIVLTSTALELAHPAISSSSLSTSRTLLMALYRFTFVFIVSAVLGAAIGFISALLFKHVDLRKTPSLEFALLLVFAYLPYGLAEAISLSGIMAILFCSITMSQYTHFNVSPVTQITMQQTFRTLAFVAGMRGAVAFALALHISAEDETTKRMLLTTTLCITLFTIIFLGGSTLPLMKILNELSTVRLSSQKRKRSRRRRERKRRKSPVLLSKTQEMFIFDHSEAMTSANEDAGTTIRSRHSNATPNAVSRFNERFVKPMFVRKFTSQEMMENRVKLRNLACEVLNDGGNNEMMHIGFEQSSSDELFGVATDPLLR